MDRMPRAGELYRHFKNKLYQIVAIALHSETKEPLVIYQALYDDFSIYARPLEMFISEVDHQKYPEVTQKYRFEKIEKGSLHIVNQSVNSLPLEEKESVSEAEAPMMAGQEATESQEATKSSLGQEGMPDPRLMEFLDADTMEEKYNLLVSFGNEITHKLIDDMAVVLDVVIPEGELLERFDQLKYAIRTRQRYEYSNRLR